MPARAHERAKALDGRTEESLSGISLPSVRDLVAQIRNYLLTQDADVGLRNNVYQFLKAFESRRRTVISMGPQFDNGPEESHFRLESGSRLSFGITLSEGNSRCSLVAYRFQVNLPEGRSPAFYRFDLNDKAHETPLTEPRCHYHPGVDDVRLPCPALTPLEVLDRVFLVIEPQVLASR